jgi:4-hydroxy-tetrahydrodipicolinate reductase
MGTRATAAIAAADDLTLTALVGPHPAEGVPGAVWATSLASLDPGLVDVVVDLTRPEVARETLRWVVANGKDAVVGTSGLTDEDLEACRKEVGSSRVLVVPNFSIGAVLLQRFAAQAAPHFANVEVIELHHDQKRDAPSGTAVATAGTLADARAAAGLGEVADPTQTETIAHARGARGPGGVHVHAVRLPGLLAHQEVLFGSPGEGLTLRHDTYDRDAFMGGLVLAVRRVDRVVGVAVGLEHVLDA